MSGRSCLGCGTVSVLLLLAGVFAVGYLVGLTGIHEHAPPVDTLGAAPAGASAVFWADLDVPETCRLVREVTGLPPIALTKLMPYEMTLALAPGETGIELVGLLSLRRFSRLIAQRSGNDPGAGARVEEVQPGLLRFHTLLGAAPALDAGESRRERVLALERLGDFEAVLDNRDGTAGAAVATWLTALPAHPLEGEADPEALARQVLAASQELRLRGELVAGGRLRMHLEVEAADADGATALLARVEALLAALQAVWEPHGVVLRGQFAREDARVTGELRVDGYEEYALRKLRVLFR